MLIQLIYASTATEPVTQEMVEAIMKVARVRNDLRDLTGVLVFDHQHFLQVLEGDRQSVNQLLAKLMSDPRHRNVTLIACREIQNRSYAAWSMGFVPALPANKAMFLRHGITGRFEPHSMSAAAALALVSELSEQAAAVAA